MAILGKTSITELNLITPLSNANLENSKITINGTAVSLGGSITTPDTHHEAKLVTASGTTSTSNTKDTANGVYFNLVENGQVRSNTILSGKTNITVTSNTAGTVLITGPDLDGYLTTGGTAADSSKLGGVAASSYATQTWVNNKNYITSAATVADSNKLGGVAASGYLTTGGTAANASKLGGTAASNYALKSDLSGYLTTGGTAADSSKLGGTAAADYATQAWVNGKNYITSAATVADSNKLGGVAASGYLTTGGTAANSSKLGGVAASGYSLTGHTHGVFTGATSTADGKAGLVKAPVKGNQTYYLKGDGTWDIPTNTVFTAGAYQSNDKLYLIGAPSQTENQLAGIITNSNSSVYMENGTLYADKIHVNKITMIGETYDFQISDGDHLGVRLEKVGGQAGSTNSNSKLYLIGAAYQEAQCDTNSNSKVYMQAGKLYANGSEVGTMETINNTVSALTASNVSLDARISAIESGGAGGSVSVMAGSGTTYLVGTPSSDSNQTLSTAVFNPSVYIQSGQCYATAFYQTSDETLKDFYEEIGVDFDELKTIPKKYFSWKDRRKDGIDIGTSAQALQKVYPELVSEGENGLTVDYARLSVVALKAIDKLHEENEMLKEMLVKMDERLSKLENEK